MHDVIENALNSKKNWDPEEKEGFFLALDTQQENHAKTIIYLGTLLDSIKKTKQSLSKETNQKNLLEEKNM